MKYLIDERNLALLARAKAQAKLALEPRPNYKPGSREVLISALTNVVNTIDALEFDEVGTYAEDGAKADREIQERAEKATPESPRIGGVGGMLSEYKFIQVPFKEPTTQDEITADDYLLGVDLATENPTVALYEMSGDTIRATQEEPVE